MEIQIKPALRFHLTPVRMPVIKKTTSAGKEVEGRNQYRLLTGMDISAATMEISMEVLPKMKNRTPI
jgi:hypothetical protein